MPQPYQVHNSSLVDCSCSAAAAYHAMRATTDCGVTDEKTPEQRPRRSNLVSNLFAGGRGGVWRPRPDPLLQKPGRRHRAGTHAAPGGTELVNVTDALRARVSVSSSRPRLFIPRGALDVPGQGVEIDGMPAFIFLYPDAEAARTPPPAWTPAASFPSGWRVLPRLRASAA